MRTSIGQSFTPRHRRVAAVVGVTAVAADLALFRWCGPYASEGRGVLAVLSLALLVRLSEGDLPTLGLRFSPVQGWRVWVRTGLLIGLVVGACVIAGWAAWVWSGRELPAHAAKAPPPTALVTRFFYMCVFAPVLEEAVYRLACCVSLAALLGPWPAVLVSGGAFALLHVVYGNPSPENLLGGFFLAWAYLKSESIAVPVLLHGLGNLVALASQVGAWYWQQ